MFLSKYEPKTLLRKYFQILNWIRLKYFKYSLKMKILSKICIYFGFLQSLLRSPHDLRPTWEYNCTFKFFDNNDWSIYRTKTWRISIRDHYDHYDRTTITRSDRSTERIIGIRFKGDIGTAKKSYPLWTIGEWGTVRKSGNGCAHIVSIFKLTIWF